VGTAFCRRGAQSSISAAESFDPFNSRGARGAKGTQAPIRTALLSRRGAEARRSFRWAMRRDGSAFPPCGSSRFPIPISIHFSQRTQRAQRSLGDSPGCSICVHLRHLRLKIRNFHGMENAISIRRNRTEGVAEACPSLRSSRSWRETLAVHFSSCGAEPLMNMAARKTCQENKKSEDCSAEEDGGRKSGSSTAWKFRIWPRMANIGAGTFVSMYLDGFFRRAVVGGTAVPGGRLLWKAARLTGDGSPYPMREELQR
jgi:hypothetical protein